jgi:hypothetical protein
MLNATRIRGVRVKDLAPAFEDHAQAVRFSSA